MAESKKKRKKSTPAGGPKDQAGVVKEACEPPAKDVPPKGAGVEQEASEHRLLRLQADFDNYRKRVQRERDEWYQRANDDLVTE